MSDVLIKNMEMPKDGCRDCIFVNRKWHGDVCPILKREVTGNVERGGFQTDCPLVPVPPHGDLIDRDALISVFETLKWKSGNPVIWDQMTDIVKDIHTVIEAEEEV